ncbi:uncharacterized protein Pura isoform X2 [Venturia canescens]|uniref:uncharacterized protein Pura isoform X2 n=1 Tax=Venturia canescens TaxID=32260 RepID=UPI001C9BBE9F|nr:uncharacterized protein LOC122416933 isoform X2 [Venturia canescens]
MSHFDWKLLRRKKVIPVERRIPEKDETWSLASEVNRDEDGGGGLNPPGLEASAEPGLTKLDENVETESEVVSAVGGESGLGSRGHETRKSKTRRVKSYLRKCKGALTSRSEDSSSVERRERNSTCTSWYVNEEDPRGSQDNEDGIGLDFPTVKLPEAAERRRSLEEREVTDDLETEEPQARHDSPRKDSGFSVYEDASDEPLEIPDNPRERVGSRETLVLNDDAILLNKCDSSDTLIADLPEIVTTQIAQSDASVSGTEDDEKVQGLKSSLPTGRGDVASLVRILLGPIYGEGVLDLLTRQARDILVCAYHGNLENFVKSYLSPAAELLAAVKEVSSENRNECIVPDGWPLTLSGTGLVLQLGELEASTLRHGECYLCVRKATSQRSNSIGNSLAIEGANTSSPIGDNADGFNIVEIALVWRSSMRSPGILGWDREDEFMDWRDPTRKSLGGGSSGRAVVSQSASSSLGLSNNQSAKSRPRRRSREESTRSRSACSSEDRESEKSSVGSKDRYECESERWRSEGGKEDCVDHVEKCARTRNDSQMTITREEMLKSEDSGLEGDSSYSEEIAKCHTGLCKMASLSIDKWKEASTNCPISSSLETSGRSLKIEDLESPIALERAINGSLTGNNSTMYDCSTKSSTSSGFCSTTGAPSNDTEANTNRSVSNHSIETLLLRDETIIATNNDDLADLISTLVVSVERKIERVNLDDLVFPCPACRNIDTDDPLLGCKCGAEACECPGAGGEQCECGIPNHHSTANDSRTFEIAGIKHIDSDDEEEVRMGFGTKRRVEEISTPRSVHDLPDHVLNCGLKLPGYADSNGRFVLEFEPDSANRKEVLCAREIAAYILYLVRLRSDDRTKEEWTFLVNGASPDDLEMLDRALVLLKDKINVIRVLILRLLRTEGLAEPHLSRSRVKTLNVDDATINEHLPKRRDESHDHAQWITFYKDYDSLMSEWQAAGRRLALEMSELKECTNLAGSLTPLNRLLTDPTLRRTSRDAAEAMSILEERAAPLAHLDYVSRSVTRARRLIEEVGNAATRLESSFESRRATIRNLAVLRSIEDQAREVLNWLCKKGEDVLAKHAQHIATTLTVARLHEREFEKFYFTSMRHLDKGSDLAEAASASGLRELARSLKQHLRGFGSRLEDRREYLEDTSRCCLLQDRAYEWAHEARMAGERRSQQFLMARPPLPPEHFTEMIGLAEKLGNDVLLEQCRIARNKCTEALEFARSVSALGSPARRRSLAPSESATSWDDGLGKRASWDDSDSNASYTCPAETIGNGSNGSGRPALDNIAELRESAEQLLDCSPPRTPPRSPAPRRLAKPPVNSHLHRAPSIAPGMKAKKTILLIMREMIQTERDYVRSLEYIIENYIPELVREDIPQAMRGQRNVIFGNVEKIYEFHSQHFLRELEQCEQSPMMVGQCFLRHEKKFYLYALYNKNKPNSDSLMAEYGTSFFKTKQLELGDKMDLASYLLKPVQRMGKYALLLQQLVKAGTDLTEQLTGKEDKDEHEDESKPIVEGEADLRAAEQMVRFQLRHGNDLLAMDSLRDCDVNVKEQGRLLRQNEFLVWQGKGKKCLRQVFLFEDLILFSKARRFPDRKNLDIYIYKHSIKTTDIGLTAVIADSPTKFEIWFRKRKPGDTYTLQCASEDIKKAWTEELSNLLWKQALRNREVRLAEMSSMGIGNKPCLDIRPSADQINDRSISVAQLSKTPRFRNSIAVSMSDDSGRCSRRPHSVISVSSSSSSGGSSGPPTTLHLGLDTSPRPHHRSTTLNSQCSVESGIIADISIVSDDGGDGTDRNHWKSTMESPTSHLTATSTPLQSPTSSNPATLNASSASTTDVNLTAYDQEMSINL